MPQYSYEHPSTRETIDIIQTMSEDHKYIDSDGIEWNRVFSVPQMQFDIKVDPNSIKDFAKVTDKPGTLGDLMDRSAELSAKRADKNGGIDPVKQTYFDEYSKKRSGAKHPEEVKQNIDLKLKNAGLSSLK